MRIRTQLILAAFVLAVVPLAAIVSYSYYSSREALETAYRRETERIAGQMDKRLGAIRAELEQRMTFVSSLPLPSSGAPDASNIATAMGPAASFVDSLEFQPLDENTRQQFEQAEKLIARAESDRERNRERPREREREPEPDAHGNPPVAPAPPAVAAANAPHQVTVVMSHSAPRPPDMPLIIELGDIPAIPRYVMSEEQRELIGEIATLGTQLGNRNLPEDVRKDIAEELTGLQKELDEVVAADRRQYEAELAQSREAMRQYRERFREDQRRARAAQVNPVPNAQPVPKSVPVMTTPEVAATEKVQSSTPPVRALTASDAAKGKQTEKKTTLLLGKKYNVPVRQQGEVVGQLTARVSPEQVIGRILGASNEDGTEVPFAIDREGNLYARTEEHRQTLERLGIPERVRGGKALKGIEGWIVSSSTDPQSGLRIGVARPVGETFDALRNTAARNFALGLGLIAFALIGIVPLSNHLTRDVKLVTDGAERIAHGDLMTRLPVKTKNELGQLARAFNRMAEDLSVNQQKLLEQERAAKEKELQQRLMAVEYERKTVELEDARRFQLSMLPKEVPQTNTYGVGVFIQTATEVGGDYYDFHLDRGAAPGGADVLSVTIGDATGHGAKAGTMVTVVKTLFAAYSGVSSPAAFLSGAAETIKRMELGRMAMALTLARFERGHLTLASAGMPPALVHRRATGEVEELSQNATPLGTLGTDYHETTTELASGDTVLFLTDGLPELMNDAGQQFGYAATIDAFAAAAAGATANDVIASLAAAARRWHGDGAPNDDVTFVVVRLT